MNAIGETLSRERGRQGLGLQEISQRTKIGTRMLQAIEAGDLRQLPGGVFTRSFIKQYAEALGIDADYIDGELKNLQLETDEAPPVPAARVPLADRPVVSSSAAISFIWVALALICCVGVYYFLRAPEAPKPAAVERAAERGAEKAPEPVRQAEAIPAVPQQAPAIGNGSLTVVLSASEASWVSVSVDGKLKFSGILQPNDRREISADQRVKVVAGNAGGIDISLNGKTIEALGPKGQVRTVELTRAGAQVVSRTPKPGPLL